MRWMTTKTRTKCVAKASCPDCGSSDGVQIFEDTEGKRNAYCFACDTHYRKVTGLDIQPNKYREDKTISKISIQDILELSSAELPDRGLKQETLEHFGVKVGFNSSDNTLIDYHFYPCHNKQGELTGYKQRICSTKSFLNIGDNKDSALFGQTLCQPSKKLFVTEGETDALALYQVLLARMKPEMRTRGFTPSVVSVTTGASGAANQMLENIEFLKKFKEIIICFDNDDPGRKSAEKVAKSIEIQGTKVLIATLPLKDANEMLLAGREEELSAATVRDASAYEPDGIVNAVEAWDRYKDRKSAECHPYPEAFEELNQKTYGWRYGSVVTVTSGSGMGKTQFIREVMYDVLQKTDEKIAYIALEEDIGDTMEGLMALHLNKRISLPDVEVTEEEEKDAFNALFGGGRVELYDHFGGMDDTDLFSRIKYFSTYLGCRVFALDHLSIVISETADEGDERRRIDAVMTKLAKIAKELDVVIFLVVHLRKAQQGKSFEEGHVPTSDDLRGSGSIKQLSWDVIALARNQQDTDATKRNTTAVHILKCRFSGKTGAAGHVFYNDETGRLVYAQDPSNTDDDEFEEVM